MRSVVWSPSALDDLDSIINYVAAQNPAAALRVIDRIEEAGERLGEMATGRPGRVAGTYEKVVPGLPYILAYSIEPQANRSEAVVILRAIHGARNWPPGEWPE
jgi:addiction module RelE/StbE family toxin